MGHRSYLRTKAPAASGGDFVPMNQVRSRPFVQTKALAAQAVGGERSQAGRLDAGLMQNLGIQPKLTVGQPGDKYEHEADAIAAKVVNQIHAPQAQQKTVQREALPEEEDKLQEKSLASTIQRQEVPEEEELKKKPLADSIQREELPEEKKEEETIASPKLQKKTLVQKL